MIDKQVAHYRIVEKLGEGGMGVVYKARDTHLDRFVAIKVLPPEKTADPERKRRFVQEAKAASALNHPNIITIHDIASEAGHDFMVMEFVPGRTLAQLIGRKGLPIGETLKYAVQAADGLAKAHARGIIHRDLKPTNIMVTDDGLVKVLDFGLAKLTEPAEADDLGPTRTMKAGEAPKTEEGAIVGTVAYMSPEQAEGKRLDGRSDIFSFGSVLYEMVTGKRAFQKESKTSTLGAIIHREPEPLGVEVPQELRRIITRCLRKDRTQRFQHMDDLKVALEELKEESDSGKLAAVQEPAHPRKRRFPWPVVTAVVAALLALGTVFIIGYRQLSGSRIESLAVLPFINVASNPEGDYLVEGITESLITNLSRLPGLRVKSYDSVSSYKRREKDPETAGRELGVRAILKGRLRLSVDTVSISVELIDAGDGAALWGETYERPVREILAVQTEIARQASERLRPRITTQEQKRVSRPQTENPEAYQLYLMGRYRWNRRTEDTLKSAADYFQQAIEKDPNYAKAWAGLADAHNLLGTYGARAPAETYPRGKAAATRALELDPELAEAHASLGWMKSQYEWDWSGAENEYRRAIELNPEYATAYHWRAWYLAILGRLDEAVASIERARQLDPASPVIHSRVGLFLYFARQYERAMEECRKSLEMDPTFAWGHGSLGAVYLKIGRLSDGVAEIEKAASLTEHGVIELGYLGHAYAAAGRKADARSVLSRLKELSTKRYVPPLYMAMIHAGLGEKDAAFELLDKAVAARSLETWYLPDPRLDPLRQDQRFQRIVQRLGLPASR